MQLVQRLRDQDPKVTPALAWLDAAPGGAGHDGGRGGARRASAAGRGERDGAQHHHQHAPDLRRGLGGVCSSSVSLVDDVLQSDSGFARDGFRHAQPVPQRDRGAGARLEPHGTGNRAAPRCRRPSQATSAAPAGEQARRGDPGYHLIAGGRRAFEAAIGYRPAAAELAGAPQPRGRHRRLYRRRHRCRGDPVLLVPLLALLARIGRLAGSACWRCSARFRRSTPAVALVNRGVDARLRRDDPAGSGAARRRSAEPAHAGRRPDAADDARDASRSRSSGWRSTISPARKAICISRCCRTGPTPRPNTPTGDEALLAAAARRHRAAESRATGRRPAATASSCCIAGGSGTTGEGDGSAGSASAASCTN